MFQLARLVFWLIRPSAAFPVFTSGHLCFRFPACAGTDLQRRDRVRFSRTSVSRACNYTRRIHRKI